MDACLLSSNSLPPAQLPCSPTPVYGSMMLNITGMLVIQHYRTSTCYHGNLFMVVFLHFSNSIFVTISNTWSKTFTSLHFRVCLSWASSGGALSMKYDDMTTDLISSDMKTWPLSDQKLSAGDVTLFIGSDGSGGNVFHGFVKDMVSSGE